MKVDRSPFPATEPPVHRNTEPPKHRLLLWSLGLLVLLSLSYVFRSPLLRSAASLWIINEPLRHADAIVVLGGGLEDRPFEAARLYHAGWAPKILYMNVRLSPTERIGLLPPEAETTRKILLHEGVPETNLVAIGASVTSTYDESQAVKAWVTETQTHRTTESPNHRSTEPPVSLIIATDIFHTRRVRWLFRRQLKPTAAQVTVRAVDPPDYTATNWWSHEQGVIAFQNEVLKFAYYRMTTE